MASAFVPSDDLHVWVTRSSVTHIQRRITCCTVVNVVLAIVVTSFVTMQIVSGNDTSNPQPSLALSPERCDPLDIKWQSGLTRIDQHELIIFGDTMYRSGEFNGTHEVCFETTYATLPLLYNDDFTSQGSGRRLEDGNAVGGSFVGCTQNCLAWGNQMSIATCTLEECMKNCKETGEKLGSRICL